MKRYLITTANERSWKFDRPVLFLGEWCRLYNRKHVWEAMDAIVDAPYGLESAQKLRDIKYVQALKNQILTELTDTLNNFHQTRHTDRYWNIVLGHWLERYVAVTFNRYFTLERALNKNEVDGTTVFDSNNYSLAKADSRSFFSACNDDIWNNVLYSNILKFLGYTNVDMDCESLQGISGFTKNMTPETTEKPSIKAFFGYVAKNVLPRFSSKHDAFIINSYLPKKIEIGLHISLGQCPQMWRSPQLRTVLPSQEHRKRFCMDTVNYGGFERFVRLQLLKVIPTCYLEGYNSLVRQVESLPWPHKPRFIFTSNNFDMDEIFKAWVGWKVEKGYPYFIGQHGNNYGTHFYYANSNWPEHKTSDKFITWGWTSDNSRNTPAFLFKIAGFKHRHLDPNGGLLLIEYPPPYLITTWDCYFEYGIYQEEQFRFVDAISEEIQKRLTVRLHIQHKKQKWSDEQRWKDHYPNMYIENGSAKIHKLIAQSRLVVHSYDSTGFLETLALNIPTLCFWRGGLEHLKKSAKPYYELLIKVGILADTPEQAGKFTTTHWDNLNEWWESNKVQDARKVFCKQYARAERNPVKTMKHLLTSYEKNY